MKKYIVTTTIQPPTEATIKFSEMNDWTMIIVGDKKTPHESYEKNSKWLYMSPEYQDKKYKDVSDAIGWNCIMRRNIGFIEAYRLGADIVASIDDDNIPYDDWGKDLLVDTTIEVDYYNSDIGVIDPMQLTNHKELWHRGFPIDRIYESKKIRYMGKKEKLVEIQVSLWDGDPDVDALCRLIYNPTGLKLTIEAPFTTDNYVPFNSQNTFMSRSVLPNYMVLPHVGRSDDIWGGYLAEWYNSNPVFTKATTNQVRNAQSIHKNLDDELFGYRYTSKFLDGLNSLKFSEAAKYIPDNTWDALLLYKEAYRRIDEENEEE